MVILDLTAVVSADKKTLKLGLQGRDLL